MKARIIPYKLISILDTIYIPDWLMEIKKLSANEKIALALLLQKSNRDGFIQIDDNSLAYEVGISERTARRILKKLTEEEIIKKKNKNYYQINIEALFDFINKEA